MMRAPTALLSLMTTLVIAVAPVRASSTAVGADSPELSFQRYRSIINLHDFDLLAQSVIARDAKFSFDGETHLGIEAVRKAFALSWSILPDEVYSMVPIHWLHLTNRSAIVFVRYSYHGTTKDGRPLQGSGAGINLFRRGPSGWWLSEEHLSPDPMANPAELPETLID